MRTFQPKLIASVDLSPGNTTDDEDDFRGSAYL